MCQVLLIMTSSCLLPVADWCQCKQSSELSSHLAVHATITMTHASVKGCLLVVVYIIYYVAMCIK